MSSRLALSRAQAPARALLRRVGDSAMSRAPAAMGEAGQGLVRATVSDDGRLIDLHVSSAIGKEGPKAIQGLVYAAVNRAHDRLIEDLQQSSQHG